MAFRDHIQQSFRDSWCGIGIDLGMDLMIQPVINEHVAFVNFQYLSRIACSKSIYGLAANLTIIERYLKRGTFAKERQRAETKRQQ